MKNLSEEEKEYFKEVKDFEKKYSKIISEQDNSYPVAMNLESEKRKFFTAIADDNIYNPQLKFEKRIYDKNLLKEFKKLRIKTKNDIYGFKSLYNEKAKKKYLEFQCFKNWGDKESSKYSIKYFKKPNRITLSRAKKYCRNYKREIVKFERISAKEMARKLKEYVYVLTKKDLEFEFKTIASKVHINAKRGLVRINPKNRFTSLDYERLRVHEIGVHYMRYFNGQKFNLNILETGTANYLETEEGLAAYVEEVKGVSSKAQMFIYAGRVIAVHYALRRSFYEVFKILKEYGFKDEDAFAITYRAKRNMSDTSKKGGFTKDYVYFSGYHKVKEYAKLYDLESLFIGKIKLEDLKLLKKFIDKNFDKIETILD